MLERHASIDKDGVDVAALEPVSNREIYGDLVEPLINEVLDGKKCNIFIFIIFRRGE